MGELKKRRNKEFQRHKVLIEIYKHYIDLQDFYMRTGQDIIEIPAGYYKNVTESITISFTDLKYGLDSLSPRKKEAFLYHVIYDKKQKEVAEMMGITTVTVGQYTNAASENLCKRYFAEIEDNIKFEYKKPSQPSKCFKCNNNTPLNKHKVCSNCHDEDKCPICSGEKKYSWDT